MKTNRRRRSWSQMEDKLYDMMDWAEIEAVVYSEENQPRNILGPTKRKTESLFRDISRMLRRRR